MPKKARIHANMHGINGPRCLHAGGDSKNFPQVPCSLQLDKEDELFDVTHGVRFQDLPIKLQSKLREYSLTTIIMPSDTDLEAGKVQGPWSSS